MTKQEFLEKNFLDEKNFELQGSKDGYTQSIDGDQVAEYETSKITMYYDEYALINLETDEKTVFTQDEMLEFVSSW